jgi:hypothetical protein
MAQAGGSLIPCVVSSVGQLGGGARELIDLIVSQHNLNVDKPDPHLADAITTAVCVQIQIGNAMVDSSALSRLGALPRRRPVHPASLVTPPPYFAHDHLRTEPSCPSLIPSATWSTPDSKEPVAEFHDSSDSKRAPRSPSPPPPSSPVAPSPPSLSLHQLVQASASHLQIAAGAGVRPPLSILANPTSASPVDVVATPPSPPHSSLLPSSPSLHHLVQASASHLQNAKGGSALSSTPTDDDAH